MCYERGEVVPRDSADSTNSLPIKATPLHNTITEVRYANGRGVPRDLAESIRWYRLLRSCPVQPCAVLPRRTVHCSRCRRRSSEALHQGFSHAQFNLGVCHENGQGVAAPNVVAATRLYRLAAEMSRLCPSNAVRYANGDTAGLFPKDVNEAARLYKLAADQGFAAAQLRECYERPGGLSKDDVKAARLFGLAACGYGAAQYNLGTCFAQWAGSAARYDGSDSTFSTCGGSGTSQGPVCFEHRNSS